MDGSIPTFEEFRDTWLENADIRENLSPTEKGRRFSIKLIQDWLDIDEASVASDLFHCDGACDGGIDIAFLQRGNTDEGDTWYLVQSKYGNAFRGNSLFLTEAHKILDTLDNNPGNRSKRISTLTLNVLERLEYFYAYADAEKDKIVLLFATIDDLSESDNKTVADIRAMGKDRLGYLFDVQTVSTRTIYRNFTQKDNSQEICVSLHMPGLYSDQRLNAGLVSLTDLYDFLEDYRRKTGDINRLYEKNVRQFLTRSRVNPGIKKTLNDDPDLFGLYNNGITLVVNDIRSKGDGVVELVNPYVVNGCQTTQTIWAVFDSHNSGGTGKKDKPDIWKQKSENGTVITKIVKISADDEAILENITRYTNKQNAVTEKDFLALNDDFQSWKEDMEKKYNIFLEVQRGGWDAYRALQRRPNAAKKQKSNFIGNANAFDLIKVFGAGWLAKPGEAWNSNSAFLPPHGEVFKQLVKDNAAEPFGVDDLFAAYQLHNVASEKYEFGRIGIKQSKYKQRGPTRFLFYMIVIEFLKAALSEANMEITNRTLTQACLSLFYPKNKEALSILLDSAVSVIDEYMNNRLDNEFSIDKEPNFTNTQSYLRHTKFGTPEASPQLTDLLNRDKGLAIK